MRNVLLPITLIAFVTACSVDDPLLGTWVDIDNLGESISFLDDARVVTQVSEGPYTRFLVGSYMKEGDVVRMQMSQTYVTNDFFDFMRRMGMEVESFEEVELHPGDSRYPSAMVGSYIRFPLAEHAFEALMTYEIEEDFLKMATTIPEMGASEITATARRQ